MNKHWLGEEARTLLLGTSCVPDLGDLMAGRKGESLTFQTLQSGPSARPGLLPPLPPVSQAPAGLRTHPAPLGLPRA